MTTESIGAAPGWYPDGFGAVRFFDGTAWTTHTQPSTPAAPAEPAAARAAEPAASQGSGAPFYRQGWFVVDAVVLVGIALLIAVAAAT